MLNKTERGTWTSASNAAADLLCEARHTMQRDMPEQPGSADATFGTRIHEALAKDSPDGLEVQERDIYESCQAIVEKKAKEFFGTNWDKVVRWNEHRIWIKFSSGRQPGKLLEHSAKADRIYRFANRLVIPEFKTLAGEVAESPLNLQLRDQAVTAARDLIADEVGVLVVQPLVTHSPEITLYTKADLERAKQELFTRVDASNFPAVDPTPGEIQCKYCRAKTRCVQYQRWAGGMVLAVQSLLDVPVSAWTPEQRTQFCNQFNVAQNWLNQTWERMEKGVEDDPNYVPGYILAPGQIRETITQPQEVFNRFCGLVTEPKDIAAASDAFMMAVNLRKGELKKQLSKVTGLTGLKLTNKLKELLTSCTETKETKRSLVKNDGARREIEEV